MTLQEAIYKLFDYELQVYTGSKAPPEAVISDLKHEVWRILFYNQIGNLKLKRGVK